MANLADIFRGGSSPLLFFFLPFFFTLSSQKWREDSCIDHGGVGGLIPVAPLLDPLSLVPGAGADLKGRLGACTWCAGA